MTNTNTKVTNEWYLNTWDGVNQQYVNTAIDPQEPCSIAQAIQYEINAGRTTCINMVCNCPNHTVKNSCLC
jgi:thiazole synthase ThiGH ThiG subunit